MKRLTVEERHKAIVEHAIALVDHLRALLRKEPDRHERKFLRQVIGETQYLIEAFGKDIEFIEE